LAAANDTPRCNTSGLACIVFPNVMTIEWSIESPIAHECVVAKIQSLLPFARSRRIWLTICALLFAVPSSAHQQESSHLTEAPAPAVHEIGNNAFASTQQKEDPPDWHTQLIQISAVVTGKNGNYVEDLRPDNFKIAEDGIAMKILSADHYHAGNPPPDPSLEKSLRVFHLASGLDRNSVRRLLLDHRVIVLYFDMTTLSSAELKRAVDASTQFVKAGMTSADLISVVSFGAGFAANANFTNDRAALQSALASLVPLKESMSRSVKISPCAKEAVNCEVFRPEGEGQADPNEQQGDLSALFDLVVQLRELPGRKSVIHFTGILPHTNGDFLWSFIGDVSNLGATSLYEVDVHGHATAAQEALADLAQASGGEFFPSVSDFGPIFERVQRDSQDYYLLSYKSANTMFDCNFPNVSVKLEGVAGANIKFRPVLAARESPPPFKITLLAGYHHCTEQGIDSAVGSIAKTGGLHISYDIIDLDVDYKTKCDWCEGLEGLLWRRDQTINGHRAIFALTQNNEPTRVKEIINGKTVFVSEDNIKKRLVAIFPDAHTRFSATIQSEDQIADMVLMLSTFEFDLPIH
jgi:VWFA-related protein